MIFNTSKNKGFTLIETMVAIAILLVAVVGPMKLMGDSLSQIYTARDQILALSLAQEGIEAVRQVRDSNMLARWKELETLESGGTLTRSAWDSLDAGGYKVNVMSADGVDVSPCASCDLENLEPITLSNGFYEQGGVGVSSRFSRVVFIENMGTFEKKITSKVSWKTSGNQNKEVVVKESLFAINE